MDWLLQSQDKRSSIEKYTEQVNITNILSGWCDRHDIDGVVWTALVSNFSSKRDTAFSVEGAITYLQSLQKNVQKHAQEYFQNAPHQINTPLRRRVKREWPEYQ